MSNIYNGIMGLVVGDALGVPFEFKKRDTFKCTDMTGYGTYNQPPGTWSDDSSMTLATMSAIIKSGEIDLTAIMESFVSWYVYGEFTPYGKAFDIGNTTRRAIYRYTNNREIENCGSRHITDNGNGSLMRILPLAFIPHTVDDIYKVSALTHAHQLARQACKFYIYTAEKIMSGASHREIFALNEEWEKTGIRRMAGLERQHIRSTGYVLDTLEAAMWCFCHTNNYRDCVLTAVNLGDDTDTVAAVVGGLAGLKYGVGGEKGIPLDWIEQIARADWIKNLCDDFEGGVCK